MILKRTVDATLVKLGDSGVGVARINPAQGPGVPTQPQGGGFLYFRPRDLPNYQGETWPELASKGLTPGRALQIDVDVDSEGAVHHVSSVRLAG